MEPIRTGHLAHLLGPAGLYEHALLTEPRHAHGYCVDDNARALVVLADQGTTEAVRIRDRCLRFVLSARTPAGWHNRMSPDGAWTDVVGPGDTQGRVVWGLGEMIHAGHPGLEESFIAATRVPLRHLRSICYAILGAAAAVDSPAGPAALSTLATLAERVPPSGRGDWRWPESRLTYDNARIPQTMIVAGSALGADRMVEDGLDLLDWLVRVESSRGGFSFTPVGGRGPGETGPAFDQQPIEAWAMADACAEAALVTGHRSWAERAALAIEWFQGRNDTGTVLYDSSTGAGYDGLEVGGANLNRGTESTLSALGALKAGNRLVTPTAPEAAS